MTRSTAQLTTLLLLAALAVASAKPRSARRSLNEATTACEFVTVPQLCTSLAAKSGATTVPALTVAAVNEATATAQEAKVTVERIIAAPITDAKLKANLDVCWKSFADSLDTLQKAGSDLQTGAPHNQLVTHISAAITYVGHCNDGFSQNPGLVSPVADVTSILKKLVSNSLALAVSLQIIAKSLNKTLRSILDYPLLSRPEEMIPKLTGRRGTAGFYDFRIRIKLRPQAWVMFVRARRHRRRRRRRRIRMAANTCCRPTLIPSAVSLVLLVLLAATAPAISSSEGRTLLERLNKRPMKTVQVRHLILHCSFFFIIFFPSLDLLCAGLRARMAIS
ncbi:unnamed protein product [Musa textilis]